MTQPKSGSAEALALKAKARGEIPQTIPEPVEPAPVKPARTRRAKAK